jgi:hypothetical protein
MSDNQLSTQVEDLKKELTEARELIQMHKEFRESLYLPERRRLNEQKYLYDQYDLACEELGIGKLSTDEGDTLLEAVCRLKSELAEAKKQLTEGKESWRFSSVCRESRHQLDTLVAALYRIMKLTTPDPNMPYCNDDRIYGIAKDTLATVKEYEQ